jgi:hypothetical protein
MHPEPEVFKAEFRKIVAVNGVGIEVIFLEFFPEVASLTVFSEEETKPEQNGGRNDGGNHVDRACGQFAADADVQKVDQRKRDFRFGTLCIRDYLIWKEDNRAFEEPSLFRGMRMDIGGKDAVPEQVQGASVTAGFFPTLGARPLIGRTFSAGDDRPGASSLAVLGESIWRRRFHGRAGHQRCARCHVVAIGDEQHLFQHDL